MMNTEMHGKKIAAVFWPDTETEKWRFLVASLNCGELHLSATHHGDHDEFWIVRIKDGVEVARYNQRYVETIQWACAVQPAPERDIDGLAAEVWAIAQSPAPIADVLPFIAAALRRELAPGVKP